jgi:hypothetical protein
MEDPEEKIPIPKCGSSPVWKVAEVYFNLCTSGPTLNLLILRADVFLDFSEINKLLLNSTVKVQEIQEEM